MSEFTDSLWSEASFSQNFLSDADHYLPDRQKMIDVAVSFYHHFIGRNKSGRVLDLGCGDGILTAHLLKSDRTIQATLVDGSAEMLGAARQRLSGFSGISFISASFQELLANDPLNSSYDFILSSLAIHHLSLTEKKNLFAYIFAHLEQNGCFLNIDVVLPPAEELEPWYLKRWKNWIADNAPKEKLPSVIDIPHHYKQNKDNTPDTLADQLEALKKSGFSEVDCYYKDGIFSIFGGRKLL